MAIPRITASLLYKQGLQLRVKVGVCAHVSQGVTGGQCPTFKKKKCKANRPITDLISSPLHHCVQLYLMLYETLAKT